MRKQQAENQNARSLVANGHFLIEQIARSVIAAHQRATVIGALAAPPVAIVPRRVTVAMPGAVMPAISIAIAMVAVAIAIGPIGMAVTHLRKRFFLVAAVGRERTGAGIGRALVDVVVLGGRLGEPLIAPAGAAGAAAGIAVAVGRHIGGGARIDVASAAAAVAARRRGRNTRGGHGHGREQSLDHLTHYSL